jgi:hypothetical protein
MCQILLPNDNIQAIKYFTARVSARPQDPNQPVRQQTYIRALQTLPNFTVIYGHFLQSVIWMRLETPTPSGDKFAKVIKTEEKGSDVNLATHLLHDGHMGKYQLAVVITNDSDLLEPIRVVRRELGLDVGLINPYSKHPSKVLTTEAKFVKKIRKGLLSKSQFPNTLHDVNGTFHKPPTW